MPFICRRAHFVQFMDSLYDNEARDGYTYWHRPGLAHLERKLEF